MSAALDSHHAAALSQVRGVRIYLGQVSRAELLAEPPPLCCSSGVWLSRNFLLTPLGSPLACDTEL